MQLKTWANLISTRRERAVTTHQPENELEEAVGVGHIERSNLPVPERMSHASAWQLPHWQLQAAPSTGWRAIYLFIVKPCLHALMKDIKGLQSGTNAVIKFIQQPWQNPSSCQDYCPLPQDCYRFINWLSELRCLHQRLDDIFIYSS